MCMMYEWFYYVLCMFRAAQVTERRWHFFLRLSNTINVRRLISFSPTDLRQAIIPFSPSLRSCRWEMYFSHVRARVPDSCLSVCLSIDIYCYTQRCIWSVCLLHAVFVSRSLPSAAAGSKDTPANKTNHDNCTSCIHRPLSISPM